MATLLKLRSESLDWREIDGEVVALEAERSLYVATNPAGTVLWSRLAEGATRGELVQALLDRWPIDDDCAARDVDAFLTAARTHGLLE